MMDRDMLLYAGPGLPVDVVDESPYRIVLPLPLALLIVVGLGLWQVIKWIPWVWGKAVYLYGSWQLAYEGGEWIKTVLHWWTRP